jgi:hypothetical protein
MEVGVGVADKRAPQLRQNWLFPGTSDEQRGHFSISRLVCQKGNRCSYVQTI